MTSLFEILTVVVIVLMYRHQNRMFKELAEKLSQKEEPKMPEHFYTTRGIIESSKFYEQITKAVMDCGNRPVRIAVDILPRTNLKQKQVYNIFRRWSRADKNIVTRSGMNYWLFSNHFWEYCLWKNREVTQSSEKPANSYIEASSI